MRPGAATNLVAADPSQPTGRGTTPSPPEHDAAAPGADPRLQRSLRWLIAIRLVVITSVVLPYLLSQLASPTELPTFDFLFALAGLTYIASLIYIVLLRALQDRPVVQAFVQFAGDLVLVTGLVYFFGGIGSPFSLFYLVVIMVAAVMLRRRAGLLVATIAYLFYGSLMLGLASGRLQPVRTILSESEIHWRLPYNLAIHLFGFYAVALLTSYLGENVRRAEEELELTESSLADLEAFHRDLVQSLSTGILTTDLDGHITSANRAAVEILDQRETDLIGRPIGQLGLFDHDEWRQLAQVAPNDARTRRAEGEISAGGKSLLVGYNLTNLTDARGTAVGTILIFQDLTKWRDLQEALRRRDRMVAVGELAAGLAHEVGNPLAAISGSVQLLSAAMPADDGQRKLLDIIRRESLRLDRTIKGFLRFARPRERSTESFDIAALLNENTSLLRNSEEASGTHAFRLELDPPAAELVGDRDQISQIFWNLARNALRAMPDGGTLTVRGSLGAAIYRIEFQDTGRGMTEEQRARLFEPFQSFFDGGTGIGMAIVYRIVHEHGGRIEVESSPGAGTRIAVELPLAESVVPAIGV